MADTAPVIRVLLENRRARFEYTLLDSFEAGVALLGSEVKSLRKGEANLLDAFVQLKRDGAWLHGLHINPWPFATHDKPEPLRPRRLLLHEHELSKMDKAVRQKGMTLVPVRIYLKGSRIKIEISISKGKKLHDKRATMKERDAKRDLARGQ